MGFSRLLTRRRASSVKGKMVLGLGWLFTNFPGRFLKVAGAVGVTAGAFWAIKPHAFRFMCDRAFEDIDSNGQLDHLELQLAVYELYNRLSKRLPGWSDPPSRDLILDALKKFDKDGNMKLDKDEFHEFAKEFITAGSSFFSRFSRDTATNAVLLPAAVPLVKTVVPGLSALPDSLATPLLSSVGKVANAINPMNLK